MRGRYPFHDRYSYGFGYTFTPAVKRLIGASVVVFILQLIFLNRYLDLVGLYPIAITRYGFIWQFFTYMFLHGGFFHLLFNMFALWMFGSEIERALGTRRFLEFYVVVGVGAALFSYALAIRSGSITIGASGAVFGILVAYAMMYPNRIILAFLIVPMKAKHYVLIFGLVELLASVNSLIHPGGSRIAYFVHVGGLLFGFLYMRYAERLRVQWRIYRTRRREQVLRRRVEQEITEDAFIRNEIDPILDKISRQGMGSLSRRERRTLRNARYRLR